MRGFALAMLHRRMRKRVSGVHRFDTERGGNASESIIERLHERMTELSRRDGMPCTWSATASAACWRCAPAMTSPLPPGRIVCMGSPLNGSASPQRLAENGGAWLLGHSKRLAGAGPRALGRPARGRRDRRQQAGRAGRGAGPDRGRPRRQRGGRRNPPAGHHRPLRGQASHSGLLFSAEAPQQAGISCARAAFRRAEAGPAPQPFITGCAARCVRIALFQSLNSTWPDIGRGPTSRTARSRTPSAARCSPS